MAVGIPRLNDSRLVPCPWDLYYSKRHDSGRAYICLLMTVTWTMTRHILHGTTTTGGPSHSVPPVSTVTSTKVYCSCHMPADDIDLDDDMMG